MDATFWLLVLAHVLPAAVAPLAAIVAFVTRKGGRLHLRAGTWFTRSMFAVAVTGIAIDVIRLAFFVKENHTKYAGYSMPSSYPARLGFLYVALCVLYFLREATPPRVFRLPSDGAGLRALGVPVALVTIAVALIVLIVLRYNPWTGALWMVVTFAFLVAMNARARLKLTTRAAAVAHHRFGMTFLAAFSWWGALQGFGPALAVQLKGLNLSTEPYRGDQPGGFSFAIFFFLLSWAPLFVLGALLVRRFARRALHRS